MMKRAQKKTSHKVALVVPHVFINRELLPHVIFAPGSLALDLAAGLGDYDVDVTLFTPGTVDTEVRNITADMSGFERELELRGYGYMEFLKKHPATFVALARQIQAELISKAYQMANDGHFDLVHVYANEEDIAMQFANLCDKPVLFTHHDPFNFLIKYKSVMPRYKHLNWISISKSQRAGMPEDTNWVANIYHGVDPANFSANFDVSGGYFAYVGRIIEPKGVHLAVEAVKLYNRRHPDKKIKLKIVGKHYSDVSKDQYWEKVIKPRLSDEVEYVGFLQGASLKDFLKKAHALIVPSTFSEPFGMVSLEALASGTPVIGLSVGATSEIVEDGKTGFIISETEENARISAIADALEKVETVDRRACRAALEENFTLEKMIQNHAELYRKMAERSSATC
jgi:glycosyltransferase involved in cell wall biosynthesis